MASLYLQSGADFKLAPDDVVVEETQNIVRRRMKAGVRFHDLADAKKYLPGLFAGRDHEVFSVASLDAEFKLISFDELFRGQVGEVAVAPREVIRTALVKNAHGIILVHNHPNHNAEPSEPDIETTYKIAMLGSVLDVDLVDHFIVGAEEVVSMRDRGILNEKRMLRFMRDKALERGMPSFALSKPSRAKMTVTDFFSETAAVIVGSSPHIVVAFERMVDHVVGWLYAHVVVVPFAFLKAMFRK